MINILIFKDKSFVNYNKFLNDLDLIIAELGKQNVQIVLPSLASKSIERRDLMIINHCTINEYNIKYYNTDEYDEEQSFEPEYFYTRIYKKLSKKQRWPVSLSYMLNRKMIDMAFILSQTLDGVYYKIIKKHLMDENLIFIK